MKKYIGLLRYELKTLFKDSMNLFLIFYPFIMLIMLGWIIPLGIKDVPNEAVSITLKIAIAITFSVGGYIAGALLGFMLIENKDENTLINIAVTPITVTGYTIFKIVYTYVLGIIGNIIIVGGLKLFASDAYTIENATISLLDNLSWLSIIIFALVNAMFTPIVGSIMASFAKNKIEAFAFVKGGGFIVMLPLLVMLPFFFGYKQYILGILPNFWPLKAMMNLAQNSSDSSDLNYYAYMLIGAIYLVTLGIVSVRIFVRKIK